MIKLIASALLSVGIATAAMAADVPSAGASAAAPGASATSSKATHKHSGKRSKKSTPAPSKS